MNQYRTETIDKIIEYASEAYGLQDWQYIFIDGTPWEARLALEGLGYKIGYAHSDNEGIAGFAEPDIQKIFLFWKDIKSTGTKLWVMAHELGHAAHFTNIPESIGWDTEQQEAYADEIAEAILYATGIWES